MIVIKPKMRLGPLGQGRDSLFSNRSTSNGRKRNRYQDDDSPEEFKIAPLTTKNNNDNQTNNLF